MANQSKPPLTELVVMSRPAVVGQATPGHIMIAVSRAGVGEQAWGRCLSADAE